VIVAFTILGEPASKANSREIVTRRYRDDRGAVKSRPMSIKSDKALAYERYALRQIPSNCRVQLSGPVRVTLRIFYASERPDLDESVVLDVLQSRYAKVKRRGVKARELVHPGVYVNDRQVREKHVFHGIDRTNPRAEVIVEPLAAQQSSLPFEPAAALEV
jgi:Holliday junction resolvase RusA-like endonuclease